jgi:hypothetical protein
MPRPLFINRGRNSTASLVWVTRWAVRPVGPATADRTNITVNGQVQVPAPAPPRAKDKCKKGGWKTFTSPSFRNQGLCIAYMNHHDDSNGADGEHAHQPSSNKHPSNSQHSANAHSSHAHS